MKVSDFTGIDPDIHPITDETQRRDDVAFAHIGAQIDAAVRRTSLPGVTAAVEFYSEEQERDERGRWTSGGGSDSETDKLKIGEVDRMTTAQVERVIVKALDEGKDTLSMYDAGRFGSHGEWSPEREALHHRIIDEYIAAHASVPKDAEAIIMAGLSGSGKTTILEGSDSIDLSQFVRVDPDIMKDKLIESGEIPRIPGLRPTDEAPLLHEESSKLASDLATRLQADGTNYIWDITLNSKESGERRIAEMHDDLGPKYHVTMMFSDVSIETAQERAASRHEEGGRFLHPEIIERQRDPVWGTQNRAAFEALKPEVDNWELWDNNGTAPRLVERG